MSCLDNLIGVKGCGSQPHSFYINQLTGINIPDFDKALSPEMQTAKDALGNILHFATSVVEQDVNTALGGRYQLKTVIDNDIVGYYYEDKVLMPSQPGVLTGYEIRIDQLPYLTYFLEEIKLFANYTGTVPVYVYDLIQGQLLDTINMAAVAGEIVTAGNLDKKYPTKKQRLRLFIGYDSQFEAYNTSYLNPYGAIGGYDNCNTCMGAPYKNAYIYFRSAQVNVGDPKTRSFIQSNNTSGGAGLSLSYSLQCSFTEHLCNMRNQLALSILYKAGSLVMKELKHSRRLTGVVTVYNKNHDELMREYEQEYEQRMAQVLQNMEMPDSICFRCTPRVKTTPKLP